MMPGLAGAGSRTGVIEALRSREREAKAAAPVEHTSPEKIAALEAIRDRFPGTSCEAQEARLLEALAQFPITTFEAMRHLDNYHAPARVMGLRRAGHEITTVWTRVLTEAGVLHRVGTYILARGAVGA